MGQIVNFFGEQLHLQNRYFVMRHGESLANQQKLIVSSPKNGCSGFGLSERGRRQVTEAIHKEIRITSQARLICSDFMRTRETAEIVASELELEHALQTDQRLRERNFGDLELQSSDHYTRVWREDAKDPGHQYDGVESVRDVMMRLHQLCKAVETRFTGIDLVFVSHGDVLQMLQTAFDGVDPASHRSIAHLNTAEIRLL